MHRLLVPAVIAALAFAVSPASAVDDAKPSVSCFGFLYKDKAGDAVSTNPAGDASAKPENLDLIDGFLKFDAAKNETTVNIRIKNLTTDLPPGATAINWQVNYVGKAGTNDFLRASTDASGIVTYDYGGVEETPAIPFNVRKGPTTGAFFEGPEGLIQMVFPEAVEPKGQVLKAFTISANEAIQVLPAAAPTPVKGGSVYATDTASGGSTQHTIGQPCPATPPPAPPVTAGPPTTFGAPTGTTSEAPLPVKVATTKFKAKKVKKGMTFKLSSTEPLTQLAARLLKGKKAVGKGSLAKLNGKGSLKLKARGLKKGSYVLELSGTDGKGARRFKSFKIRVK